MNAKMNFRFISKNGVTIGFIFSTRPVAEKIAEKYGAVAVKDNYGKRHMIMVSTAHKRIMEKRGWRNQNFAIAKRWSFIFGAIAK